MRDRARDEDREGDDKREHKSSKSRRLGNGEEADGLDSSNGRRRSTGDRNESRKRSSGSSRAGSDEDDHDARNESHSKQMKKKQEENTLEKLSNWYQDGEPENKHDGGNESGKLEKVTTWKSLIPEVKNLLILSTRARSASAKIEPGESKSRGLDSCSDKDMKSHGREDRRVDAEKSKSKGKSEVPEEDSKESSLTHEDRLENSDIDYEISSTYKQRELEKDGYRDRSKGRGDNWSDRNGDWGDSKDNSKRGQPSGNDRETKDGDIGYNHSREWELQRYGRKRIDHKRPQGRSGGRKDGSRTEAMKTSSNYGISNGNYDVIEIQTRSFDCEREESGSFFSRRNEVVQQSDMKLAPNDEEWAYPREDKTRRIDICMGLGHQAGKTTGQRGVVSNRTAGGQTAKVLAVVHSLHMETRSQVALVELRKQSEGVELGEEGVGLLGDSQQVGIPMPMMGSSFGPLGMPPPGQMRPLTPSMLPAPGPPISPGVLIPPFAPPVVWPGARGVEMNMLAIPPGLSPVPPGPSRPRFSPNVGTPPNPALYFNQSGPGRVPPNISGPGFNAIVPVGREQPQDKAPGGWVPPRTNGPAGKAPPRGEQNDYSQNFVDTGMQPQNFIRELELTNVVEDYPNLRELIQKKDEIVTKSIFPPMYYKCEHVLSLEFFGTKFDVILVDSPWEEYAHRAPGVTNHMEYWTFEEIMNLKIEINKTNAPPGLRHDSHTLFQRSKEHFLMGIKGTVCRNTDGHIIHANIDTDVIIADEPPYGSTAKPEDMYRIIEHFCLGRRRLELFGEDHNIWSGWLTVGK
ncbi:hypothetical protein F0562_017303 [Nyssa sinensis]|uniref:Methyltransferase-like protein 1 n=1 Tax=Nyssa sinensis TaxID=561372 RepID=A0A5J4ZFU2_9ASTE|nr:hypothetical protein F0562_017303 [Nyssa sinensis]